MFHNLGVNIIPGRLADIPNAEEAVKIGKKKQTWINIKEKWIKNAWINAWINQQQTWIKKHE